ncbi:VOC family protein [Niveispirillum sp.]|uniref:VOC family protein n=1 Tax=Niveispirillum sp. TaxID=1917217 RepID=UPI001B577545|nr:VOC family protein [Niveispirillum sp.]MBP7338629.1 VOC family protein [Niveispirillum sp.]
MSLSKAIDIASVRFSAPDLQAMRAFLHDFGLRVAEDAGDGVLRMRGLGPAPFIHETVQGDAGFVALSLRVSTLAEMQTLADADGTRVEPLSGPGGGHVVRMRDPDGYRVEAVCGDVQASPLPTPSGCPWNSAARQDRTGQTKRISTEPAHIVRLGHVVLGVSDITATWAWWQQRFGLLVSDEVRTPDGDVASLFIRCDRGTTAVDHHTLNFARFPGSPARFHHAAFEVSDLDDLMAGNRFLAERGHVHEWGVGRHILGSQVFDYWRDPWGHRLEHWTDGDLFDANAPTNVTDMKTMMGCQWGPAPPGNFAS